MRDHTHPGTCPGCPEPCELCDDTGRVYEIEGWRVSTKSTRHPL